MIKNVKREGKMANIFIKSNPPDYRIRVIVKELFEELDSADLTVDEYSIIAALGSISKQLQSFNVASDLVDLIDSKILSMGFIPGNCGDKIKGD